MHDLAPLFEARSVAVLGASSDSRKLGGRPIHLMKQYGYAGAVYPINPNNDIIQGLRAYRSLSEVDDRIDMAIVLVPAPQVEQVVNECIAKRVKLIQILSSGFAETGIEGAAIQERITTAAKRGGVRITGPNALGSISPSNGLIATFSSAFGGLTVTPGHVGFATQSGAFGSASYVMGLLRGMGVSRAIATGNEADIEVADCIDYLVDDVQTKVICAALESCKSGAKLRAALRKAAYRRKPVIIMKVGTSDVGARAAATHTGALAGDDRIFSTIFRECGALRAGSIEEMIDIAYLVSVAGVPQTNDLAILTVSGGIGVLMADAAAVHGLAIAALSDETLAETKAILPFVTGNNPLDTTAQIAVKRTAIAEIGEAIFRREPARSLIFYLGNNGLSPEIFGPSIEAIVELKARWPERRIVCVMPSVEAVRQPLEAAGVAVFEDPTRAIRALGAACALRALWDKVAEPANISGAAPLLPARLDESSCKAFLAKSGLHVLPEQVCESSEEAADAAERMGFPVVAKIVSADIPHKTEIGGVRLELTDRESVISAFDDIMACARTKRPDAAIDGVLITPMKTGGVETILGVHTDAVFGPMLLFGMGGVMAELLRDVSMASIPLTRRRAESLIEEVKGAALLNGWRGGAPMSKEALIQAIMALSDLVARSDEIAGVDINPLLVGPDSAIVLDAVLVRKA